MSFPDIVLAYMGRLAKPALLATAAVVTSVLAATAGTGTAAVRSAASASTVDVGRTVLLQPRTKVTGCRLGARPDRRCSPGAYSAGLTKSVICAADFRTTAIRHVTDSTKHAVEIEYGLEPKPYGKTLEIDHIVSLELGGSNDIANLFPEKANAHPGYPLKDKLENRLHELVCRGQLSLRSAQRQIASDWVALFEHVFGAAPAD